MSKHPTYNFGDRLLLLTIYNEQKYYHDVIFIREEGTKAAVVHKNSKFVMLVPFENLFFVS